MSEKETPKFRGPWSPQIRDPKEHKVSPKPAPPPKEEPVVEIEEPEELEEEEPQLEDKEEIPVVIPSSPSSPSQPKIGRKKGNVKVDPRISALHMAAYTYDFIAMKTLLESGEGTPLVKKGEPENNYTPLHMACECPDYERGLNMSRMLMEYGADPKVLTNLGTNCLTLVAVVGNVEVAKIFVEQGLTDVNSINKAGNSAITLAAQGGHIPMVQYLLSKGADLYKRGNSKESKLPLHQAATAGHKDMVEYLLSLGIPVDYELPPFNVAPLSLAAEKGHVEVVRLLLERGARPNKRRKDGVFALYMACQKGHLGVVIALRHGGADLNLWFKGTQNTPINIARKKGFTAIVNELKKKDGKGKPAKDTQCVVQ